MGFLKLFSKSPSRDLPLPPDGSLAVDRAGNIVAGTLSSRLPRALLAQIGRTALDSLAAAHKINAPLSDLVAHFGGHTITVRDLRGGALIFLTPRVHSRTACILPSMSSNSLDEFILYLEAYIECWKQFNHYVNMARANEFTSEDEAQFLEVKSLVVQGLETILAAVDKGAPRKDEVMVLINGVPSIRYLVEHENSIATVEAQWHKTFLILQSLLGRLKVQRQKHDGDWSWGALFGKGGQ